MVSAFKVYIISVDNVYMLRLINQSNQSFIAFILSYLVLSLTSLFVYLLDG